MVNEAPFIPHDMFRRYLKTILPLNKIKFRDTVFSLIFIANCILPSELK